MSRATVAEGLRCCGTLLLRQSGSAVRLSSVFALQCRGSGLSSRDKGRCVI